MPDHAIAATEDVQYPGQTPDEIGAQLAAWMQRAADASRIALECRIEAASCCCSCRSSTDTGASVMSSLRWRMAYQPHGCLRPAAADRSRRRRPDGTRSRSTI